MTSSPPPHGADGMADAGNAPSWTAICLSRLSGYSSRPALVRQRHEHSYGELLSRVEHWNTRLRAWRIGAGECLSIVGNCSAETCAALFALLVNGNVIVPLAKTDADQDRLFETARVQGVIEFDENDGHTFRRRPCAASHPLLDQLRAERAAGVILFTSGSTGPEKAALLSMERFLEKFSQPRPAYRTLIFLKLDHIGGLNTLFHVLSNGGTLVTVDDRKPESVAEAVERHRIELLPTTPTFLNMLLISGVCEQYDLSSLKLITYGTEPMPASTLLGLNRVLPRVRFKQTYGLSEVGILPTDSENSRSLWLRVGGDGYETKVVDGQLWIRCRAAMLGYLNAASPFDQEGWFNTGDVVEVQGEYVHILGRKSELINVGGEKVAPAQIESVLLEIENVQDVTVFGKPNPVTGQVVVARVSLRSPEPPKEFIQRLREFCRRRLPEYQIPALVEFTSAEHHTDRFKKQRIHR